MKLAKTTYLMIEDGVGHIVVDRNILQDKLNLSYPKIRELFETQKSFKLNGIEVYPNPVYIPSKRRKVDPSQGRTIKRSHKY